MASDQNFNPQIYINSHWHMLNIYIYSLKSGISYLTKYSLLNFLSFIILQGGKVNHHTEHTGAGNQKHDLWTEVVPE